MDAIILQALLSGLAMGSIYAMIALGYYITWVTTNTLNFGQGEFLMIAAMVGLTVVVMWGQHFLVGLAAAIVVLGVMGYLLERGAIRPVLGRLFGIGWILSTVGVSTMLKNVARLGWGSQQRAMPPPAGSEVIRIGPAGVFPQEVLVFGVAVVCMALLFFFLKSSILGKALMAVAHNSDAASLMGINPHRMSILAFVLASLLAGVGGIFYAPLSSIDPNMGTLLGIKAFAAAILGGLTNPVGILVGGLAMGVLELIVANVNFDVSGIAFRGSDWRDIAVFVAIVVVLAVRPTGLLGKQVVEKL